MSATSYPSDKKWEGRFQHLVNRLPELGVPVGELDECGACGDVWPFDTMVAHDNGFQCKQCFDLFCSACRDIGVTCSVCHAVTCLRPACDNTLNNCNNCGQVVCDRCQPSQPNCVICEYMLCNNCTTNSRCCDACATKWNKVTCQQVTNTTSGCCTTARNHQMDSYRIQTGHSCTGQWQRVAVFASGLYSIAIYSDHR
jgi:hypothetical protein